MRNGVSVGHNVDPQLNSAGHGGTIGNADLLSTLTAYKLRSTSSLRSEGLNLITLFGIQPGTHDFYGNPLPDRSPSVLMKAEVVKPAKERPSLYFAVSSTTIGLMTTHWILPSSSRRVSNMPSS